MCLNTIPKPCLNVPKFFPNLDENFYWLFFPAVTCLHVTASWCIVPLLLPSDYGELVLTITAAPALAGSPEPSPRKPPGSRRSWSPAELRRWSTARAASRAASAKPSAHPIEQLEGALRAREEENNALFQSVVDQTEPMQEEFLFHLERQRHLREGLNHLDAGRDRAENAPTGGIARARSSGLYAAFDRRETRADSKPDGKRGPAPSPDQEARPPKQRKKTRRGRRKAKPDGGKMSGGGPMFHSGELGGRS